MATHDVLLFRSEQAPTTVPDADPELVTLVGKLGGPVDRETNGVSCVTAGEGETPDGGGVVVWHGTNGLGGVAIRAKRLDRGQMVRVQGRWTEGEDTTKGGVPAARKGSPSASSNPAGAGPVAARRGPISGEDRCYTGCTLSTQSGETRRKDAVKFTMIDQSKAPRPKAKPTGATAQFDELVNALVPGKVARIEASGKESPRGIKASITRAAKRTGKRVHSWDVDGKVYAALIEGEPEQLPIEAAADVARV